MERTRFWFFSCLFILYFPFDHFLIANLDSDMLWFHFLRFWQDEGQHTVLVGCFNGISLDLGGHNMHSENEP